MLHIANKFGSPQRQTSPDEFDERMIELWRSRIRIFSDSIFIFLNARAESADVNDPEHSLDGRFVPHAAAALSRALWEAQLPHRGGISFGECFIDSSLNVFLGEPIVRAYQWATAQAAFGIAVEPASIPQATDHFKNEPFMARVDVPTADTRINTVVINCTQAAMFELRQGAELVEDRALDGLLGAASAADLPERVRARYRNTAQIWLDHLAPDTALRRYTELLALAGRSPGVP